MGNDPFDFEDVFEQIKREVNSVITSPESQKKLQEHMRYSAYENVYPYYAPVEYERRYANGGLGDPENYEVIPGNMELTVINNTTGNGAQPGERWTSGYINDIIENGVGYGWKRSAIYQMQPYPRPFMQKGIDEFVDEYLLPEIGMQVFSD